MFRKLSNTIISEISEVINKTDEKEIQEFLEIIIKSKKRKIITAGAGRMGLSIKCLSMRLSHLGYNSWSIGDTCLPSISEGDILIIASGSGETESMKVLAKRAKERNVKLIVFTCNEKSTIGSMADMTIKINGNSSLDGTDESIQPMKTYIEQSTLIIYDTIICLLIDKMGLNNSDLSKNHSILE